MSQPKVMIVYGTRPEAIKLAPVIKAFRHDDRFSTVVVSTGQHHQMLNQVNTMFGIEPEHDLSLMQEKQPLNRIMSLSIQGLDGLLESESPDVLIVQGDTTTAMAAAIAGFNRGVKIVHLEAGLRSWDLSSPFPEEGNRRIISTVAALHLAPTHNARENLLAEGIDRKAIVVTGNTVIDALQEAVNWDASFTDPAVREAVDSPRKIVLVTSHRRENMAFMQAIGRAISRLAERFPEITFVIPAHLNPLIRERLLPEVELNDNVVVCAPLPYDQFTRLTARASLVITDSGGIQEEAPSLGIPVILLRDTSERPETIDAGTVRLVGPHEDRIVHETTSLLLNDIEYKRMSHAINPYGDGRAAARCLAAVAHLVGVGARIDQFEPNYHKTSF